MRTVEAKDFLVQQTAEQAALENVPLSDLEKRMMYFTETGECPENPITLNDAFEAEYDNDEYEAKVSKLMHHAYLRNKKENPESLRRWKEAMRELSKGDHYILVLCKDGSSLRSPSVGVKPSVVALVLVSLLALVVVVLLAVYSGNPSGGGRGGYVTPSGTHTSMAPWVKYLLYVLMAGAYFYYVILPWILKKLHRN